MIPGRSEEEEEGGKEEEARLGLGMGMGVGVGKKISTIKVPPTEGIRETSPREVENVERSS